MWFPFPVSLWSIIRMLGRNVRVKASSSPWPSLQVLLLVMTVLYFMVDWATHIFPALCWLAQENITIYYFRKGSLHKYVTHCTSKAKVNLYSFLCWDESSAFFPITAGHSLHSCPSPPLSPLLFLIVHRGFYIVWIRITSPTQKIKIWSKKKH